MSNNERKIGAMYSIPLITVSTMSLALVPAATAETHTVLANDSSFTPDTLVVAPGDTIVWQFNSGYPHTVTSGTPCTADGIFFDEPLDTSNATFEWVVPEYASLDIPYFCRPHCLMGMMGVISIDAGGNTLQVPGDYPTIAEAIDAAVAGDTINIAAGTYYETDLAVGDANITLRGEANADGTPAVTIDAQQQGRVFEMVGVTHPPPGIPGLVVFDTMVITGGSVSSNGGGVSITTCSPVFRNCTITQNSCTGNGGGVYVRHNAEGAPWAQAHVKFIDCTIIGNDAQDGGGMFSSSNGFGVGARPTLVGCVVTENTASSGIGGIRHATWTGQTSVVNSIICGNVPSQIAGSVALTGDTCATLDCRDEDEDGVPDGCLYDEDGILNVPAEFPTIPSALGSSLDGQTILIAAGTYEVEEDDTFAIYLTDKSLTISGAIDKDGAPAVTIEGGVFEGENTIGVILSGAAASGTVIENLRVTNLEGGLVIYDCEVVVTNCIFERNFNTIGGGAAFANGRATLTDCIFRDNLSYTGGGIGLVNDNPENDVTLIGCLIEGNTGSYLGLAGVGGVHVQSGALAMIDCTVRNNIGAEFGGVMVTAGAGLTMSDSTICANTPENDISGDWTDDGGNTIEDQCPVDCPGDINGDGIVDGADLSTLLGAWADSGGPADIDGSGLVDGADLATLLGDWGDC